MALQASRDDLRHGDTAISAAARNPDERRYGSVTCGPIAERPASNGGGVHHLALICADPERTIRFYQDLLGFPLVELFENRDYEGSSHFFFDIGNRNLLAFFDFPGLGLVPVPEGLGGVQHVAISVTPEVFEAAKVRLADAGVEYRGPDLGRRGVDLLQGSRQHPGRADPPAALRDARERPSGVTRPTCTQLLIVGSEFGNDVCTCDKSGPHAARATERHRLRCFGTGRSGGSRGGSMPSRRGARRGRGADAGTNQRWAICQRLVVGPSFDAELIRRFASAAGRLVTRTVSRSASSAASSSRRAIARLARKSSGLVPATMITAASVAIAATSGGTPSSDDMTITNAALQIALVHQFASTIRSAAAAANVAARLVAQTTACAQARRARRLADRAPRS